MTEAGQTLTYTIEDTLTGGDPVSLYGWLTSFDATDRKIHYQTADDTLANAYDITIRGTLNDGVADTYTVTTSVIVYLLAITPTVQAPIVYLLGNPVETHAISSFNYVQTSFPFDTTPTWTYSISSSAAGAKLITTVSSTDILVGEVASFAAGATTGPITSTSRVGSSSYTLTGTLSGTINGVTIPSDAVTT